jgi:hypothetical protein
MEVFDFIFDEDGDLFVQGGDLALGESTLDHQRDLILAAKGDFRQWPLIGVAIRTELLNAIGPSDIRVAIQREMERDGMAVSKLVVTNELDIDLVASYRDA